MLPAASASPETKPANSSVNTPARSGPLLRSDMIKLPNKYDIRSAGCAGRASIIKTAFLQSARHPTARYTGRWKQKGKRMEKPAVDERPEDQGTPVVTWLTRLPAAS